jgi:hypothetical protein
MEPGGLPALPGTADIQAVLLAADSAANQTSEAIAWNLPAPRQQMRRLDKFSGRLGNRKETPTRIIGKVWQGKEGKAPLRNTALV